MRYLILSLILYGLIPIVQLINMDKISILFYGLLINLPIFIFFINKNFIKNNFKEIIIAGIIRGFASIAYFLSYDIGYGPIVVSLVFLVPIIYTILSSVKERCLKNFDLVLMSSIGCYLLTSKMPNYDLSWKLLLALLSPILSATALFYFKYHIKIKSFTETVSTVFVRNILTLFAILLIFPRDISFKSDINLLYTSLYGIFILGIAMMTFFHASKKMDAKTFSIISNLEFVISFFIMIIIFSIEIKISQWIGLIFSITSIFILKFRNLKNIKK